MGSTPPKRLNPLSYVNKYYVKMCVFASRTSTQKLRLKISLKKLASKARVNEKLWFDSFQDEQLVRSECFSNEDAACGCVIMNYAHPRRQAWN